MAKAKKKQLPKDFESLLESCDIAQLKAIFDACDVNARGGVLKQTALAFNKCPDELIRWLVERGADVNACDHYGDTPLHSRACHWQGRIEVLLELGADVHHGENARGTPLHASAGSTNPKTSHLLLRHGARVDALNGHRQTPLDFALQRCSNIQIQGMVEVAVLLLAAGAQQTPQAKASVTRIGTDFEFHRAAFNPDHVEATSAALDKLYVLFGVTPVQRRSEHDGKSPIVARSERWEDQHQELWELLVPSSGDANTVQGEVIRITGRIHIELEHNGGVNWDVEYRKMADALLVQLGSGTPLSQSLLAEAREIVADVKRKNGDSRRLCELAVNWVALNPTPIELPSPTYNR